MQRKTRGGITGTFHISRIKWLLSLNKNKLQSIVEALCRLEHCRLKILIKICEVIVDK